MGQQKEGASRELENKIEYALQGIAILYIHMYVCRYSSLLAWGMSNTPNAI